MTVAFQPARNFIYKYNLSGALIEEPYPSGRVVKNTLNNDGDLALVQSRRNANFGYVKYAQEFAYTPAGALSSLHLGNGTWESTVFNSRLQPEQVALDSTRRIHNFLSGKLVENPSGLGYKIGGQTCNIAILRVV